MILTFQIDDRALDALKEALQITQGDYNFITAPILSPRPSSVTQEVYARQILRARKALMLDCSPESCVLDYKPHFSNAAPNL